MTVVAAAYATPADLQAFLPSGWPVSDVDRQLLRASELIDAKVRGVFSIDDTGAPVDATIAQVLRDATCAQVEAWVEVGEENDIDGRAGTQVTAGGASYQRAPELAPRAARILATAGLLTIADGTGW